MKHRPLCALIVAAVAIGCGPKGAPAPNKPIDIKPDANLAVNVLPPVNMHELNSDGLTNCKQATVLIGNFENGEIHSTGSGFVVKDGLTIITNRHVVTGSDDTCDPCKVVFFPGTDHEQIQDIEVGQITCPFNVTKADVDYRRQDVAIIKLKKKIANPIPDSKSNSNLKETQSAWALGFPDGIMASLGSKNLPTVSVHTMTIDRLEQTNKQLSLIQLSGSVTHGNSGGPVVNYKGEVIGIVESFLDDRAPIILAVPIDVAIQASEGKVTAHSSVKDSFLTPLFSHKSKPMEEVPQVTSGSNSTTSPSNHVTLAGYDLFVPGNWTNTKSESETGVGNYEWKSDDGLIALSGAEIGGSCEVSYQRDFDNITGSNEMGYRLVRLRRGKDAVHDGIIWNFKARQQSGSNFITILYFDKGPTSFRLMFIDTLAKKNAKLYNSIIDQVGAWK